MKLYVYIALAILCIVINAVITPEMTLANIVSFASAVIAGVMIPYILKEIE
jgi:hypothetical protein